MLIGFMLIIHIYFFYTMFPCNWFNAYIRHTLFLIYDPEMKRVMVVEGTRPGGHWLIAE